MLINYVLNRINICQLQTQGVADVIPLGSPFARHYETASTQTFPAGARKIWAFSKSITLKRASMNCQALGYISYGCLFPQISM